MSQCTMVRHIQSSQWLISALDEKEQAERLWDQGVHISEREDEVHRFILYQIDAFYVEEWYHKAYNVIRKLNEGQMQYTL